MINKFTTKIIFECLNNQKDSLRNFLETHRCGKHYDIVFIEDYRFNELYVEVIEDGKTALILLNELANLYGVEMYFISTDEAEHFYTNDIDGIYFDELYFLDCCLPSGREIKKNYSSQYEIIETIQIIMNEEYSSYDSALDSICKYCEENSTHGEYFFKVHDYEIVEIFDASLQPINC